MDQNKARPHADLIIAWANGAAIEHLFYGKWTEVEGAPSWYTGAKYRIKKVKPPPVKIVLSIGLREGKYHVIGEFTKNMVDYTDIEIEVDAEDRSKILEVRVIK